MKKPLLLLISATLLASCGGGSTGSSSKATSSAQSKEESSVVSSSQAQSSVQSSSSSSAPASSSSASSSKAASSAPEGSAATNPYTGEAILNLAKATSSNINQTKLSSKAYFFKAVILRHSVRYSDDGTYYVDMELKLAAGKTIRAFRIATKNSNKYGVLNAQAGKEVVINGKIGTYYQWGSDFGCYAITGDDSDDAYIAADVGTEIADETIDITGNYDKYWAQGMTKQSTLGDPSQFGSALKGTAPRFFLVNDRWRTNTNTTMFTFPFTKAVIFSDNVMTGVLTDTVHFEGERWTFKYRFLLANIGENGATRINYTTTNPEATEWVTGQRYENGRFVIDEIPAYVCGIEFQLETPANYGVMSNFPVGGWAYSLSKTSCR
ncbi:MAG: hypothetical protein IJU64_06085 [Bacilli bacterium]|nr:hypothetical protein [Bacilli bacterium]